MAGEWLGLGDSGGGGGYLNTTHCQPRSDSGMYVVWGLAPGGAFAGMEVCGWRFFGHDVERSL